MPPHCDSLDGPVVNAARRALDVGEVDIVLPFVPEEAEAEVRAVFDAVVPVRALGREARDVADRLFFETVVRLHRAGEGAPYDGLRPAGLSVGPVIPLAATKDHSVPEARSYVEAMLGFEVYSHHLLRALQAPDHEEPPHVEHT